MAKKKENKGKIKWGKILVWMVGVIVGLILVCVIGFKIWVSTWQPYRNDEFGFSLKVPKGWDIKDPRKDSSDSQFVFDYGSILKFGDSSTDFPKNPSGDEYKYMGNMLIYVYQNPVSKNIGTSVVKIGSDNISRDFIYSNGKKSFYISVTVFNSESLFQKIRLILIEKLIINSFAIFN